jgi:hypothetical protein
LPESCLSSVGLYYISSLKVNQKTHTEEDAHIIKRQKYDDTVSEVSETENKKDPFETLMAEDYADYTEKKNKVYKR